MCARRLWRRSPSLGIAEAWDIEENDEDTGPSLEKSEFAAGAGRDCGLFQGPTMRNALRFVADTAGQEG